MGQTVSKPRAGLGLVDFEGARLPLTVRAFPKLGLTSRAELAGALEPVGDGR
jgi:hypothetical protein